MSLQFDDLQDLKNALFREQETQRRAIQDAEQDAESSQGKHKQAREQLERERLKLNERRHELAVKKFEQALKEHEKKTAEQARKSERKARTLEILAVSFSFVLCLLWAVIVCTLIFKY